MLDGKDFGNCVVVEAANVTIRNSKVRCVFGYGIRSVVASGLLIEDTEVSCGNTTATGISGNNFTARRVEVHGCENGFGIHNDVLIEDSYVHTLIHGVDGHTDGIQIDDDSSNITIRHNKVINDDLAGTSAIIGDTGTHTNILIEKNLLSGGGYALRCAMNPANYRVLNNHFSRQIHANSGEFGPWVYCDGANTVTGNVWHDTGLPVDF